MPHLLTLPFACVSTLNVIFQSAQQWPLLNMCLPYIYVYTNKETRHLKLRLDKQWTMAWESSAGSPKVQSYSSITVAHMQQLQHLTYKFK